MLLLFLALIPIKVVRIIDGDTFKGVIESDTLTIRLIGVDCPESRKNTKAYNDAEKSENDVETIVAMGELAKEFTKKHLKKDETVYLEFDVGENDKYGRILAYVWLNDTLMFNNLIIKEGYAQMMTIPPNVKYQEEFLTAYKSARANEKGLWSPILILPVKQQAEDKEKITSEFYIGNKKSKIFHNPKCSSVKRMRDENKVIFDSREEALNTGFRPCKRCNP